MAGSTPTLTFATVRSIADQCGGHASIESTRQRGTSVTITIPLSKEAPTRMLIANASSGFISPDGKWLAYESRESGREEVYVRPWLGGGELGREVRVSSEGGVEAFWYRSDSAGPLEIWYGNNNKIYSVTLTTKPRVTLGRPQLVVELTDQLLNFHQLSDGRILAMLGGSDEKDPGGLNVVLNWKNSILPLLNVEDLAK